MQEEAGRSPDRTGREIPYAVPSSKNREQKGESSCVKLNRHRTVLIIRIGEAAGLDGRASHAVALPVGVGREVGHADIA